MSSTHDPATQPQQAAHTDELPVVGDEQQVPHTQPYSVGPQQQVQPTDAPLPGGSGTPVPGDADGKVLTTRNTLIAGGIGVAAAFALLGFGAGYVAGDGGSSDGRPSMSRNGGPGGGMQDGRNGMQGQNGMQGGMNGMPGRNGMGGGPGGMPGGTNGPDQTSPDQTGQEATRQETTGPQA